MSRPTRNTKWALALTAAALSVGVYSATVLATPSSGVIPTTLAQTRFADIDVRAMFNAHTDPGNVWRSRIRAHGPTDVYVIDNKFAAPTADTPGGTTGFHSHPGPSLVQVVAGTVTNYESDHGVCTKHVYTVGTGFVDAGGSDVHMLRNEGNVPAETIATQFIPAGVPRRTDAPDPGNCGL
jgi:hypothetical protein